jgi:hypothetical protein
MRLVIVTDAVTAELLHQKALDEMSPDVLY